MASHPIQLKSNDIHFFYALTGEIQDAGLLGRYRAILSKAEKDKTDRFIFEKDRHTCLVTRALLRYVLSLCTALPPEQFEFTENEYGKPALATHSVFLPITFNLSHSQGLTACALTLHYDIGMDVENWRRTLEPEIANRYFAPSEAACLQQCPAAARTKLFFDFWTLKESFIKARGMGLSMGLDTFSFQLEPGVSVAFADSIPDTPDLWQFFRFEPVADYKAAISIRAPRSTPLNLYIYKCIPLRDIKKMRKDKGARSQVGFPAP